MAKAQSASCFQVRDADGSLGLREIKHAGGFTFAQQPESARFPTMPRHAIETGCVDLVLRPKEIAGELARLSRRFRTAEPILESKSEGTLDSGTETRMRSWPRSSRGFARRTAWTSPTTSEPRSGAASSGE